MCATPACALQEIMIILSLSLLQLHRMLADDMKRVVASVMCLL